MWIEKWNKGMKNVLFLQNEKSINPEINA